LEDRIARWSALTEDEQEAIGYEWAEFWARPEQLMPAPPWTYWLIKAGRGWGKTRSGAECVRVWARTSRYVNLIAATVDDVRDVMVEGESGILAICPRDERPVYIPSKRRLQWPNGARSLLFSADEPDRLRGKQHSKLWCDELAAWRYPESWDQAQFGLRIGGHPQCVITTTPRPTPIVKELMRHPDCVVTGGTTYENRDNLATTFYTTVIRKYEGTRLGRQELDAEILDDNPRALWKRVQIDADRVKETPTLYRIVVGLDPNAKNRAEGSEAEELDEAGIIVAGDSRDGHYYVLDDRSIDAGPNEWAKAAVKAYRDHKADRIVGEVNNGGDMVEMVIRAVDQNVSYLSVTATRGKAIRAEPISALYEQHRVHHVGFLPKLEDELCDYDPLTTVRSPNRLDAMVWALTELTEGVPNAGLMDFMRDAAKSNAPAGSSQMPTVQRTEAGLQFHQR
jgi:phage terminase large subunit-like protein